jgi:hypothetical protein
VTVAVAVSVSVVVVAVAVGVPVSVAVVVSVVAVAVSVGVAVSVSVVTVVVCVGVAVSVGVAVAVAVGVASGGMRTMSMAWMTPLDAMMSGSMTSASFTMTVPSSVSIFNVSPRRAKVDRSMTPGRRRCKQARRHGREGYCQAPLRKPFQRAFRQFVEGIIRRGKERVRLFLFQRIGEAGLFEAPGAW